MKVKTQKNKQTNENEIRKSLFCTPKCYNVS